MNIAFRPKDNKICFSVKIAQSPSINRYNKQCAMAFENLKDTNYNLIKRDGEPIHYFESMISILPWCMYSINQMLHLITLLYSRVMVEFVQFLGNDMVFATIIAIWHVFKGKAQFHIRIGMEHCNSLNQSFPWRQWISLNNIRMHHHLTLAWLRLRGLTLWWW